MDGALMSDLDLVKVEPAWDNSQMAVIKSQIAKDCTDAQLVLFAEVCKRTGLDPFTKQIYAISSKGKMIIQVGIDGLRAVAADSGLYNGSQTFWCGEDGIWVDVWLKKSLPVAAKTEIYRGDSTRPFTAVALMSEYGKDNVWKSLPTVMLGKVSESAALRKAFPRQLSGLYTGEEMAQVDKGQSIQPSAAIVSTESRKAKQLAELRKEYIASIKQFAGDKAEFTRNLNLGDPNNWTPEDFTFAIEQINLAVDQEDPNEPTF
jgi:phage recombination protein Bet